MKILVAGSSNVDLTARVDHLPLPGETVTGAWFEKAYGGKGANQAVAAARLGGEVTFVTRLGTDKDADGLRDQFRRDGISLRYIQTDTDVPTGTAFIFVASDGQNCISVAPGANAMLLPDRLDGFEEALGDADMVVLQAEIPYETVRSAALMAYRRGKRVLFNPAPACLVGTDVLSATYILVVNEVEVAAVSGITYTGKNEAELAEALVRAGAQNVVITLGGGGAYLHGRQGSFRVPAYQVPVVDTVAAGDTFCGALAVYCAEKGLSRDAISFANAAAAVAVTRRGAQPSIPCLEEVRQFMQ